MLIKDLLNHIYPSCKVIVYFDNDEVEYIAGDLYDSMGDYEFSDWAMYKGHLAIFM